MNKLFLLITLVPALANSEAINKVGNDCPTGYMIRNGYCVSSEGRGAVTKSGSDCPIGYMIQGGYCVPTAGHRENVILKSGSDCPMGYNIYKGYCIER